ncbi:Phenylalanyl-tRNA synthetase alpha chain [Liberibacter crescens BT-1]|uniref:Phenylalanine--tRNA ligase alpha subunit n=1 Tax=Liberibacter crescens (strain BT-1) TaxID=1215343 RepID=L0EXG1_LIBCB|nr:phenylalanine--tRNA ligase subunit alpha [Liberibacter crescens]AGA65056.1 Phenylalanyl-tRNA synthetase alpha chain [Liberibacter crescens BT-1]AMC13052.1 phenylalanyl-tRNA synthetase subunit alpha [Liberibacter crescens]
MDDFSELRIHLLDSISSSNNEDELDAVRVAAFGKNGSFNILLKQLKELDLDTMKLQGAAFNKLKDEISEAISLRKTVIRNKALELRLASEVVDVTLPVRSSSVKRGRIHPITQVLDEVTAIFYDMGFVLAEGPDIETNYYNFTALNFPEDHPARDMHDTFFLSQVSEGGERKVLRTHTSPVQIRVMEKQSLPIRIIVPGRTYRRDSDATHSPMFHQVEGLVVDKIANVANLRWVLETFCASFFEVPSVKMRFRPSFFPFTEPSFEVDIQCSHFNGVIRFDEGTKWMEILGCGMVHPKVLQGVGIDSDVYQGFAWGIGLERITMLKYGMPDMRDFFSSDVRWINHYGFSPIDMPTLFAGLSS